MKAIAGYSRRPATNQARRAVAASREAWMRWYRVMATNQMGTMVAIQVRTWSTLTLASEKYSAGSAARRPAAPPTSRKPSGIARKMRPTKRIPHCTVSV